MENKDEFMSIRVPKSLKDQIKDTAGKNRRTMANEALFLIEKGIEAERRNLEPVVIGEPSHE